MKRIVGLAVVSALLVTACAHVSLRQEDAIVAWLTCVECTDGERSFVVDSIGEDAIPHLRDALVGLPQEYRQNMALGFAAEWARIPAPAVSAATYVNRSMANFDAVTQRRAAWSLADLGQVDILQEALDQQAPRGYRTDVVSVLQESRALADSVKARSPSFWRFFRFWGLFSR